MKRFRPQLERQHSARQTSLGVQFRLLAGLCFLLAVPFAEVAVTSAAFAQEPDSRTPVCMRGQFPADVDASGTRRNRDFAIIAASRDTKALRAMGFVAMDCAAVSLATTTAQERWRNRICRLAAIRNEDVQADIARRIGAAANILCATAELAIGPWTPDRRSID